MSDAEKEIIYVSPTAPGFSFRLGTTRVRFVKGQLVLTDKRLIDQLDKLVETNTDFSRHISKVDKEAALKVVAAHQASRGGAAHGGLTSDNVLAENNPGADVSMNKANEDQKAALAETIAKPVQKEPLETKAAEKPAIKLNVVNKK